MNQFGFPLTHHLVFFVIDLTMIICFVIGVFTPRSLDKQPNTLSLPPVDPAPTPRPDGVVDGVSNHQSPRLPPPPYTPFASHENAIRQRQLYQASLSRSMVYSGPQYTTFSHHEKKYYVTG